MSDHTSAQGAGFETIDPMINGRIRWLVSALGGPSADNPESYTLGDDVLGCLRDLKRWLRGYDEKLNRLDVARCISETSMVKVDLLEILNLLQIESTEEGNSDIRDDVSRSSTIESLELQGVFDILLSVVAGIPETFEQHDVVILEVIFNLIQGINCEQLSLAAMENDSSRHKLLSEMLQQDDENKGTIRTQSRHNRFGTTVVVQKESGQRTVLAGQGALVDEETGLQKLDSTKKWRKPQHTGKKQIGLVGTEVRLSASAQISLRKFLIDVLHSGFSALFQSVRKAIERDSERVIGSTHSTQLFYVGSAIIKFFRSLRRDGEGKGSASVPGFGELAALFQAETFIVLFRHMRECLESKTWDELSVVSEMTQSENSEEKSVAENILSRLFYEETLQELMVAVLRSGHKQSVQYSKSNVNMVVKSKRTTGSHDVEKGHGSDDEAEASKQHHAAEKHFDFLKCESKFLSQPSLESFLDFLGLAKETELSPGYGDVGTFVRYFSRQLVRKLKECPILFVELLFPKSTKTAYFLQYGKDREHQAKRSRGSPVLEFSIDLNRETRIAVALALVLQDEACSSQFSWIESVIRIALEERTRWQATLPGDQEIDGVLPSLGTDTTPPEFVVKFDDPGHALTHFTNNKLQLLMTCLGFETNGTDQDNFAYILPGAISSEILQENIEALLRAKQSPLTHLESGEDISSCVRVKRRKQPKGSGQEDNKAALSSDEDFEFPDNLREKKRRRSKKTASSRQRGALDEDEDEAEARRERRKDKERERRGIIKSALYIASSDDESDAERDRVFFEKEKKQREEASTTAIESLGDEGSKEEPQASKKKKRSHPDGATGEQKRARISPSSSESEGNVSGEGRIADSSDEEMEPELGPPRSFWYCCFSSASPAQLLLHTGRLHDCLHLRFSSSGDATYPRIESIYEEPRTISGCLQAMHFSVSLLLSSLLLLNASSGVFGSIQDDSVIYKRQARGSGSSSAEDPAPASSASSPQRTNPPPSGTTDAPSSTRGGGSSGDSARGTGSSRTSSKKLSTVDARLPPGGVVIQTPITTSGSLYYKIGQTVTFGWNYTSLSISPSAVNVAAFCSDNSQTYTIAQNLSIAKPSILWDTGSYAPKNDQPPLAMGIYTLLIYDEASAVTAAPTAGRLAAFNGFKFGMYTPKPYTPLAGKLPDPRVVRAFC
ncbi:hypothetical protein Dda_1361 [Drechslerella dactyloides]|uniref:Uncharacterized protein n=1 Tax=Drechslerella dactyloides TaxID=74499 RepID=A0AAD6J3A8_DREDA|nr:hypothetical protein Dda_1361 [Drechslerella dactyloides]